MGEQKNKAFEHFSIDLLLHVFYTGSDIPASASGRVEDQTPQDRKHPSPSRYREPIVP
jgi:hypothetical protein